MWKGVGEEHQNIQVLSPRWIFSILGFLKKSWVAAAFPSSPAQYQEQDGLPGALTPQAQGLEYPLRVTPGDRGWEEHAGTSCIPRPVNPAGEQPNGR